MLATGNEETLTSCTVCGGSLRNTRWEGIERCSACGAYLRSPRPGQDAIRDSYDSGRLYDLWASERSERKRMWRERLAIVQGFVTSGSLLDVATGDAHFADVAQAAGYDVLTTELSGSAAALARQRGRRVVEGQLCEIDFGQRRFDVVTLWHALEHLPDPGAALDRIRGLLQPHGVAIIAVPNETRRLWSSRLLRWRSPFGSVEPELEIHLTFFTPRTLRNALRLHALQPVAFGVDNVTMRPNVLTEANRAVQKMLSAVFGWHCARAMYAVATPRAAGS